MLKGKIRKNESRTKRCPTAKPKPTNWSSWWDVGGLSTIDTTLAAAAATDAVSSSQESTGGHGVCYEKRTKPSATLKELEDASHSRPPQDKEFHIIPHRSALDERTDPDRCLHGSGRVSRSPGLELTKKQSLQALKLSTRHERARNEWAIDSQSPSCEVRLLVPSDSYLSSRTVPNTKSKLINSAYLHLLRLFLPFLMKIQILLPSRGHFQNSIFSSSSDPYPTPSVRSRFCLYVILQSKRLLLRISHYQHASSISTHDPCRDGR